MKPFLILLISVFAFPTYINAQTWYLLGRGGKGATWQVPMETKEECENEGKKFINEMGWKGKKGLVFGYICLRGK